MVSKGLKWLKIALIFFIFFLLVTEPPLSPSPPGQFEKCQIFFYKFSSSLSIGIMLSLPRKPISNQIKNFFKSFNLL